MAKLEYFSIDNEFLNNRKISFSTGMNRLENDEENLYSMQISDKEKQLSDEEKISLVKKLWNSFDIECVYCKNVSEISNFR